MTASQSPAQDPLRRPPLAPAAKQPLRLTADQATEWDHWVVVWLGGRPLGAALVVVLAFLASYFLPLWFTGVLPVLLYEMPTVSHVFGFDPYSWAASVSAVLGGYAVAGAAFIIIRDERDYAEIVEQGGGDIGTAAADYRALGNRRRIGIRLAGLFSALGGFVAMLVTVPGAWQLLGLPGREAVMPEQKAAALWFLIAVPIMFYLLGKGFYFSWHEEAISRLVRQQLIRIDLLRVERLAPLVRMALRRSLLWIVGSTIGSLFFLSNEIDRTVLLPFFFAIASVAILVLVPPLYGIHKRIRAEKERELDRVRGLIAADRDVLLEDAPDAQATSLALERLPASLALEQRISNVREWPIDLPTLGRFSFYLGIPVLSWLGGALMEKVVDAFI